MSRDTSSTSTKKAAPEFIEMDDPSASAGRLVLRAAPDETNDVDAPLSLDDIDTAAEDVKQRATPWLMIGSGAMAALWAGGAGAFLLGYAQSGAFKEATTPLLAGLGAVALGPVLFLLLAGAMGEALARASRDARALSAAAARISRPGPGAQRAAQSLAATIKREIEGLDAAISATLNRLNALESGIAQRAEALVGAGSSARDSATDLSRTLADGVAQLLAAAEVVSTQTAQAALSQQSRADELLKNAQLVDGASKEAAELFGARAAGLVTLSSQAADATARHAETLEAASMRLDAAALRAATNAAALSDAVAQADAALAKAGALFADTRTGIDQSVSATGQAAHAMRASAAEVGSEIERLAALGKQVRDESAADADQRLEQVRAALAERASAMIVTLRAEADAARRASEEGLAALQRTADVARAASVAAGEAALAEASAAEKRLQALGETAFEAGKRADTVAEARLSEARALVERSVDLLSVAGDRITDRFAATVAACTEQTQAVEAVLASLQATTAQVPERAAEQAKAIEATLEASLARLNTAGRSALEEAAQIDEAFQARLRESYAALGDIVARLGGFAGLAGAMPPPPVRPLTPIAPLLRQPVEPAPPPEPPSLPEPAPPEPVAMAAVEEPKPVAVEPVIPPPGPLPDALFDDEFRKAVGTAPAERDGWRWKDLLATLDAGKSTEPVNDALDDFTLLKNAMAGLTLGSTGVMSDAAIARIGVAGAMRVDSRRKAVKQYAPEGLRLMVERLQNPALRDVAARFVEAHADAASRNALNDEMTAFYLLADAALAS